MYPDSGEAKVSRIPALRAVPRETPRRPPAMAVVPPKSRGEIKKLYKSKRWQGLRKAQLARHPWCQCPQCKGRKVRAQVVDHIVPHRGDLRPFWNARNLQSMSKACHDGWKQSQESGGAGAHAGSDVQGGPLAPSPPGQGGGGEGGPGGSARPGG